MHYSHAHARREKHAYAKFVRIVATVVAVVTLIVYCHI